MCSSAEQVDLLALAASALASSIVASRPIRKLALEGREQFSRKKLDGTIITDADGSSQRIIIGALRDVSKDVRIVGEESLDEMERSVHRDDDAKVEADVAAADECERLEIFKMAQDELQQRFAAAWDASSPSAFAPHAIDPARIAVFVDPLDGTSCYAKGDFGCVTTLVAIILDNVPCFGVICKPFGQEDEPAILNSGCYAVYGGTLLKGAYVAGGDECQRSKIYRHTRTRFNANYTPDDHDDTQTTKQQILHTTTETGDTTTEDDDDDDVDVDDDPPILSRQNNRAIISRSRAGGVVRKCIDALADRNLLHREPIHVSGAGYKTLRLITGTDGETLWFFPKQGTSLWDVAAADAILRSIGGCLSDKNGNDIDYSKSRQNAENVEGIIACNDTWLHRECVRLFQEEQWDDDDDE